MIYIYRERERVYIYIFIVFAIYSWYYLLSESVLTSTFPQLWLVLYQSVDGHMNGIQFRAQFFGLEVKVSAGENRKVTSHMFVLHDSTETFSAKSDANDN